MQKGFGYECSATPPGASTNGRRGMKSSLLYWSPVHDARSLITSEPGG
ncbi:MAG: hypothetical protein NTZ39_09005 [Methanoregula sp.]|nr:hypothetical protein [Methanoregula sp.]